MNNPFFQHNVRPHMTHRFSEMEPWLSTLFWRWKLFRRWNALPSRPVQPPSQAMPAAGQFHQIRFEPILYLFSAVPASVESFLKVRMNERYAVDELRHAWNWWEQCKGGSNLDKEREREGATEKRCRGKPQLKGCSTGHCLSALCNWWECWSKF